MLDHSRVDEWLFDLMLKREVLEDFEEPIRELVSLCRSEEEFEIVAHTSELQFALASAPDAQ